MSRRFSPRLRFRRWLTNSKVSSPRTAVSLWGLKKLAYPIQNKTTGFYFLVEFTGEGSLINTLETQYRRDERVIRFLTFKQDKYAVEYSEKRRAKLSNKTQEE